MKLWIDDIRPAPDGYHRIYTVNSAIKYILSANAKNEPIDLIDMDHDAGDYACDGGDYINLLNWLEEMGLNYPIRIHSMNLVGIENMRRVIRKNGWKEI